MIRVYESFDDELKALWRKLEAQEGVLVFQTLAWCSACERPFVIVWMGGEKGESPVVLPTRLTGAGELRFIGDERSDCGDALYVRGVNKHKAFKAIADYIRGEKRIRSVALQKMRSDSEALAYLGVMMKGSIVYRDHRYSWIELAGEDLLGGQTQFRAHERKRIKTLAQQVEKATLERFGREKGGVFPRGRIVALRDAMIAKGQRAADFLSDEKLDFVERVYAAGLLEVVVMREEGADSAISLQLVKGGRNHCWVFLYDDPRANTRQRVKYFGELVESGERGVIDFGVGTYGYKMETFMPKTGCTFSLRWGRGPVRTLYAVARMLWRFWRQRGS